MRTEGRHHLDISEVELALHTPRPRPDGDKDWRLKAFAQVHVDSCFIVHDVKVMEGADGELFIQFPSRPVQDHCPRCRERNGLRDSFCRRCGIRMDPDRGPVRPDGSRKLYADIVHPLTPECRDSFRDAVLEKYYDAVAEMMEAHGVGATGPDGALPSSGPLSARLQAGRVA